MRGNTITDDDAYHRTFLPVSKYHFDEAGLQVAWVFDGDLPLKAVAIKPRKDQIFRQHCTNFEIVFSTLVRDSPQLVQPVIRPDGALIGHRGKFSGQSIWIPFQPRDKRGFVEGRLWLGTIEGLLECISQRQEVMVNITPGYGTTGFTPWGASEQIVTVLVDPVGDVIYPLEYTTLGAEPSLLQPADVIVTLLSLGLANVAAKAVAEPFVEEAGTVAAGWIGKKTGSITIKEMEGYLAGVMARNPELAQLMRARALSGEALNSETMSALAKWGARTGKSVEFVENGAVQNVAGIGNYASVQGNKLMIEKVVAGSPGRLYAEAVHELSADALGVSGKGLMASQLPFIGERIDMMNNAFFILENGIKESGGIPEIIKTFF